MFRIDCHSHVSGRFSHGEHLKNSLRPLRRSIDKLCCSIPIVEGMPMPSEFKTCNDEMVEAMREYPDKILGYCFVNPGYQRESIEEIGKRILKDQMIGVKLYSQYKCSDPVVSKAVDLKVPVLQHAGYLTDPAEAAKQPNISNARGIAHLASLFPRLTLIEAHLGGGGDWEWALKTFRTTRNVYVDASGSVIDCGMIEKAVKLLGAERLVRN